jgi:lysophospholipase L1-like esterase
MQLATAFNNFPRLDDNHSSADTALSRWTQNIGVSGATDLIVSFMAGKFSDGSSNFIPLLNNYTVSNCYIEYNGVAVQVTFDGGGISKLVTAGGFDVQSDAVLASSFGVSEFAQGADIAVKFIMEGDALGDKFPNNGVWRTSNGNQSILYDRALSTVGNIDGVGEATVTGNPIPRASGYSPIILTSTGEGRTIAALGDSITVGVGETDAKPGWFCRLTKNAFANTDYFAMINCGIGGSKIEIASDPVYQHYLQYANEAVIAFGTNDFSTSGNSETAVSMGGNYETLISELREIGYARIIALSTLPRTTSSDNWRTVENQTPLSGWDSLTDETYVFAKNLETYVPSADETMYITSVRDSGDEFKWVVDGSYRYAVEDGTHPSEGGYELMAQEVYSAVVDIAPTVSAGPDITPTEGDAVTLSGATASNFDSLQWTCTTGQTPTFSDATALNPTVTFNEAGLHTLQLTATNTGGSTSDTLNADVQAIPNVGPTANAGADQASITAGDTVTLDGSGSSDSDGTIVSYAWAQTAGDTAALSDATAISPTFTAPTTGGAQTLTFQLTVTDDGGLTASDSVDVQVNAQVIESTLNATLTGIPDGTYKTRVIDTDSNTMLFLGDKAWSSEAATFTLTDVAVGTNVEYYAHDDTNAGLDVGVTE